MKEFIDQLMGDTSQYFCSSETLLNELKNILANGSYSQEECELIITSFIQKVNQNDELMSPMIINSVMMDLVSQIDVEKLALIHEHLIAIDHYL